MKTPSLRRNFISEWFSQRIYPKVRLDHKSIAGANFGLCPFLSTIKKEKTRCIKNENALGVCTINSAGKSSRQDWLVCPYRVIDSEIVKSACETIFRGGTGVFPIPISILSDPKGLALLEKGFTRDGKAVIFFQDKLGGEISINGTASSPEIAFDVTVVEILKDQSGTSVGRYGFIEIQTMDFHGSYRAAVANLRDAHRLHGKDFSKALAKNPSWMSKEVEGPNIANVFKRTFYQMLLKFELSKEGAAAGTVLALPKSVWDSWQPFLGCPNIRKIKGNEFSIGDSDKKDYHGTNAWVFVFELDEKSRRSISSVNITAKIRVSATDLVEHAFVNVPKNIMHWATNEDVLLRRIEERIRKAIPTLQLR